MHPRIHHRIIAGLFCFVSISYAGPELKAPPLGLSTVQSFTPGVLASEWEAQVVYESFYTGIFKKKSTCFQRAHVWADSLFKWKQIKSYKLFLLFTDRYRREFDYRWTYHVAPMIPTVMNDGTIQNLVFDPWFTSDKSGHRHPAFPEFKNKPLQMEGWIRYFVFPHAECPLIDDMKYFEEHQEQYYCYTMIAPMYNYLPENFEEDEKGNTGWEGNHWYNPETRNRTDWRVGDLLEMENGLR